MSQRVFITGATGFIGRHLANELIKSGYIVLALVRNPEKFNAMFPSQPRPEMIEGDLNNTDSIAKHLKDVDILFHVAGVTKAYNPSLFYKVNLNATKKLYASILNHRIPLKKIVHISSLAAIGPSPSDVPLDNFVSPHPVTNYGISKLKGEQEAMKVAQYYNVVIIRPPAVFGPGDLDVLHFFKSIQRGIIPIIGNDKKLVSLVFVMDLVRGIVMAAESENTNGKSYFLCYRETFKWSFLGKLAAEIMGIDCRIIKIPHALVKTLAAINEFLSRSVGKATILNLEKAREIVQDYWICSPCDAEKDFNFSCRYPIDEAFKITIAWYKNNGYLPRS